MPSLSTQVLLVSIFSFSAAAQTCGDDLGRQITNQLEKAISKEALALLGTSLDQKFSQAMEANENCYAIFGSHQTKSGKPLGIFLRDEEIIMQEIAWDMATQTDGTFENDEPIAPKLNDLSCYRMSGNLKSRIPKCEAKFQIGSPRIVSTRKWHHQVIVEVEFELTSTSKSPGEYRLRVDFADPTSEATVASLSTVDLTKVSQTVRVPVALSIGQLPGRVSAEMMLDVLQVEWIDREKGEAKVQSASNTAILSTNIHQLKRVIADGAYRE